MWRSWLAGLLMMVLALPAFAEPRFHIVHTPRAAAAARLLADDLEVARDRIAELMGRDYPGVTEVRLGFDREEYEAYALPGGKPPTWAVALAYPKENIILVEAHSLQTAEGPLTLRHELVHVALGQLGSNWPHWFQEGLAMELTGERKWKTDQLTTLSRAVAQNRVFAFDDLREHFPAYPDDVEIAYAQSAAFVDFLRARHGPAALRTLVSRVNSGDSFEKAFGVAFHVPLSMEEDAFRRELPSKYPWWPLVLSGETALWGFTSVLLVMAFVRRRKAVRELRAEQFRIEVLHEEAKLLLGHHAQNDDVESFPEVGFPTQFPDDDRPWTVNIVLQVDPFSDAARAPDAEARHAR